MISYSNYINALIIKGSSLAALFILQVVLARLLGIGNFGAYSYLISIITVSFLIVVWGGERYLVKIIAVSTHGDDKKASGSAVLSAYGVSLWNTFLVTTAVVIFFYFFKENYFRAEIIVPFYLVLISMSFSALSTSITKGGGYVLFSEFVTMLLRPVFVLSVLLLALVFNNVLSVSAVLLLVSASYLMSLFVTYIKNRTKIRWEETRHNISVFSQYKIGFPFLLVSVGFPLLTNIDILVLGTVVAEENIAIYVVCSKIINIVLIGLATANMLIAPKLPVLFKNKKLNDMQALVARNNIFVLGVTVIPVIMLVVFGDSVLGLFGKEYESGYRVLMILLIAQVINVLFGPVNLITVMTGHQMKTSYAVIFVCLIELFACIVLVPEYGIYGAAVANMLAFALVNLFLALIVKKQIGIDPTVLGTIRLLSK